MNRRVIITNGTGNHGKDTFYKYVSEIIPSEKFSSIDMIKLAAKEYFGWDGGKTEKDRKFLSDLKKLSKEYNNMPFEDIKGIVKDFYNDCFDKAQLLFIDIREPEEIEEAVRLFKAKTVLVRDSRKPKIISNDSDKNVYNYTYDYIVENGGTLEELKKEAVKFVNYIKSDAHE